MHKLIILILIYFLFSCKNSNSPNNNDTYHLQNKIALLWGDSTQNNTRFNIGIVYDGISDQKARELTLRAFGNEGFSLFNTIPFNSYKDKFNIYYGTIPAINDSNILPTISDSLRQKIDSSTALIDFTDETSLGRQIAFLREELLDTNKFTPIEKKFFSEFESPFFFYADYLYIKFNLDNNLPLGNYGTRIKNNLNYFYNFFNNYSFLNTKYIISLGINGAYANDDDSTIYMPMDKDFYTFIRATHLHSDVFAVTATHEFGHIFADLVDEYYSYESFGHRYDVLEKNCFGDSIANPWVGIIPDYDGSIFKGACGGETVRGTFNSIMRIYYAFKTEQSWQEGWGPINTYYIKQQLNALNN